MKSTGYFPTEALQYIQEGKIRGKIHESICTHLSPAPAGKSRGLRVQKRQVLHTIYSTILHRSQRPWPYFQPRLPILLPAITSHSPQPLSLGGETRNNPLPAQSKNWRSLPEPRADPTWGQRPLNWPEKINRGEGSKRSRYSIFPLR